MQLYFYQRILQLRAAQEQEARKWIACLQSIQSEQRVTLSCVAEKPQPSSGPAAANSPGAKSATAAGDGILMINARSSVDREISPAQEGNARGVLPAHLFVEESRVSYSPLSEHAAASPFLSDAHMLTDGESGPAGKLTSRQPASTAEAATSTEDEAQMSTHPIRRLNFVEPTTADSPSSRHQRSQSAMPSSQSPGQEALAVSSRSASYHASSSSPFDHATGGLFAPEDIDHLYALPDGAHPGRLRFTDDLDSAQDRQAAAARASSTGGSSPLYRSCSSGSDDNPAGGAKGDLSDAAGTEYDVGSVMQQPVSSSRLLDAHSTAAGMQTSRDDRVFWVPEHGGEEQPFTEYTKQQMGSTLHQAPAPVQPRTLPSVSTAIPRKQSSAVMQQPSGHAWTTPRAEADTSAAKSGRTQLFQSAHAWSAPLLEVDEAAVGYDSSSWQGSFSEGEGPHPPDLPGRHAGLLHATSGFRGGRRGDPRLRRFKAACTSAETPRDAVQTSTAVFPSQYGSTHSAQDHSTRNESSGMQQAVDSASCMVSAVGFRSAEVQMSHQLTEVEMIEPEEKKYWRAPPSLAWATLPMTAASNDAGSVTWAEYCSDSEESTIA